ncbi:TIGR01777 family oxidoreductase [Pedobacter immunditicola]|uniref:TIGR01777 family oxidoreductase n=1 Tax=Pedobacter immunditicola TaxID=3133440 RepID=UPI0030984104
MKKHILITGATGMIGKELLKALQKEGHTIAVLSRKRVKIKDVQVYLWDVYRQKIDAGCLDRVDTIVHLAGENVAEKKWTRERKQQIIDSRVLSTQLLYKTIRETPNQVKDFISASAVGYYGDCGEEILTEEKDNGYGFLAECCEKWENAVDKGKDLNLRVVKIRTGFVLKKDEGGLASMDKPVRFFVGAPLGTGQQWVPWIHIKDMVRIYLFAISNPEMQGAYNACAPYPVTNKTLTKAIAHTLNRPVWPIKVPETVLNAILGEMSTVALMSTNTSAQKLLDRGFTFNFTQLDTALKDIYNAADYTE